MKKVFYLMAIAATIFAVSCNKEEGTKKPGKGGNEGGDDYVAAIKIDGDFSDWAKLDASKVDTYKCAETAAKTDLKTLKVYADDYYVYLFVDFDFTAYDNDIEWAMMNVYLNGDNDTSTGGQKQNWDQGETPCIDLMCQGAIKGDAAAGDWCAFDPGLHKYTGEPGTSEWAWEDVSLSGFITGMGGAKGFEIAICRELYPLGKLANPFTLGVQITVNGWDATGALPNTEATEENVAGEAPLAIVTIK